ncbi:MAG: hypothetical protein ACLFRD_04640 [Nitriliruptoraceae bacterium]
MTGPATTRSTRQGVVWPWIIAAATVVIVTVALVLTFGVERPPGFDHLDPEEGAAPEAAVAWTRFAPDGPCLWVQRPDGSGEEVACGLPDGELVGWDDSGLLLETYRGDRSLAVLDPDTGEVIERAPVEERSQPPAPLESVITRRPSQGGEGGPETMRIESARGDHALIAEIEAPGSYEVRSGAYAPDGGWVALFDNADRLLLVQVDDDGAGLDEPVVWAEDVEGAGRLVWEGTPYPGDEDR